MHKSKIILIFAVTKKNKIMEQKKYKVGYYEGIVYKTAYFNTPSEVCDFLNNICDSNFVTYKKDDLGYWRVDSTFFTIKK